GQHDPAASGRQRGPRLHGAAARNSVRLHGRSFAILSGAASLAGRRSADGKQARGVGRAAPVRSPLIKQIHSNIQVVTKTASLCLPPCRQRTAIQPSVVAPPRKRGSRDTRNAARPKPTSRFRLLPEK